MASSALSKRSNFSGPGRSLRSPPDEASLQNMTTLELLQLLEIQQPDSFYKVRCHGRGKNKDNCCGNPLSTKTRQQIAVIIQKLAVAWYLSNASLQLLEELAKLVMCVRLHQNQGHAKVEVWKSKLSPEPTIQQGTRSSSSISQRLQISRDDSPAQISNHRVGTTNSSDPLRSPSSQFQNSISTTTTAYINIRRNDTHLNSRADTQGQRSQSREETENRNIVAQSQDTLGLPTQLSRQTRSMTRVGAPSPTTTEVSLFEPMSTRRTPRVAADDLLQKLVSNISKNEFSHGLVYGYRRPGCELIKIGITTKPVQQRMYEIETKCKYVPKVVFQIATKYAMKVERLIHKHLHKERRRECLQGGLCNDGKGCSGRHYEWFEGVSDERARSVAQTWVDWIRQEPFDEKGCLKPAWAQKIKLFDYNSNPDIWMSWTKTELLKPSVKEEEDVKRDVKIKAEFDYEATLETSLRRLRAPRNAAVARGGIKDEDLGMYKLPSLIPRIRYVGGASA